MRGEVKENPHAMTALKTSEVDGYIARPDGKRPIVLVFGPDAGLVRERADAIIRASVDDLRDPFSLVRLDGDELSSDPARLIDEAQTVPLFGGRRAIHIKSGGRNFVPAVEPLLASPPADCRVVIEAGDLRRNAPLRTICERAKTAVVIACYADGERDLARLIDDELRAASLTIAPDARSALAALIGGDRRASRNEIRKLALYAHGKERVTLDDVYAVVADASALAHDGIADSAFAGKTHDLETQYSKARAAGTLPGVIASSALRQVMDLHRAKLVMEGGAPLEMAVEGFRPPLHFKRKPAVEAALRAWSSARLQYVMEQLAAAALESRRRPALGDAVVERALLAVAQAARRKD
jgi:DNA polymerase III subunit delta